MANEQNLKPFKKGDPRINRNGRPKSFDTLRKLAQQILVEVAKDKDGGDLIRNGHKVTNVEAILVRMLQDKRYNKDLLELAYGKVPQRQELTGADGGAIIVTSVGFDVDKV